MKILHTNISKNYDLNEDDQTINLKFAFCTYTTEEDQLIYYNLHPLVKCRDFLNDFVYCMNTDISFSIYGFNIEKGHKKTNDLYLNLMFPSKETLKIFKDNFDYYMPTYDFKSKNNDTRIVYEKDLDVILEVDNNWFLTSQSTSALTLLLRLFCNKVIVQKESIVEDFLNSTDDEDKHTDHNQILDYDYQKNFDKHLNQFIKNYKHLYGRQPAKNYLDTEVKDYIHGYSGIFTFLKYIYQNPVYLSWIFFKETREIYLQLINHE